MERYKVSKKLSLERYHWFHGQIKANRFPNAKRLADNNFFILEARRSELLANQEVAVLKSQIVTSSWGSIRHANP
jgi:hypothetical protein